MNGRPTTSYRARDGHQVRNPAPAAVSGDEITQGFGALAKVCWGRVAPSRRLPDIAARAVIGLVVGARS